MRRILRAALVFILVFWAQSARAQSLPPDFAKEMGKLPPQAALEFFRAVQTGDYAAAQKIYEEGSKKRLPRLSQASQSAGAAETTPSLFERTLSGDFPSDLLTAGLRQFGYETFLRTASSFTPASVPVGPDYLIGPGDRFTLTLWGTTEGIFALQVTNEGNVTLPKAGVVPVAGVRFGELERTLRRHLSRYYANFNLSIAMGDLKTVTVYVVGEVSNPGSYPVHALTTVYGALFAAGGPTKKGTLRNIEVLRSGKVIRTLDLYDFLLKGDRSQDMRLQHEDTVFVPLIGPVAGVAGTVYRPAIYELRGNETIGDAVRLAGGIMPIALASRIQLQRFADNEKKVIMDIKLPGPGRASAERVAELKDRVQNMDMVSVLPIYDKAWETVTLSGHVGHQGDFQWRPDLHLKEVVEQGQLLPTSDMRRADIIRLKSDLADREIIPVDLDALMNGDEALNVLLRPRDIVRVYTNYREPERITVAGEVARPGAYEIHKGEKLSDLLRRVGGFTSGAYAYGAVFKRRNVRESQAKNLRAFITRLQAEVLQSAAEGASSALSAEDAASTKAELSLNQGLLNNLTEMQAQFEGRIAIAITENVDEWAGSKDDLALQDGDSLFVPKRPQEVLVMGEVHSPGGQVHQPGMKVKEYIERSGGTTRYAEDDRIFVVQANGYAYGAESPETGDILNARLQAGDVVFVPQRMERYAGIRTTRDIVDILFKTAVVIATITVLF